MNLILLVIIMNYFDKSKLRIIPEIENNYYKILNDFTNFDFNYTDRLGRFKIDTLF